MKKKSGIKIVISLVTIVFLIYLGWYFSNQDSVEGSVEEISDLDNLNDMEDGFIYIGRPTCPHCAILYPRLEQIVKEENVTVLYLNTDEFRETENLTEILNKFEVIYVPSLIELQNGEVVNIFENTAEDNEQKTLDNLSLFLKK
ncbi:thioredoxin family protein [Carnobacterium sp.]|uniref:thioredoxin family protein n=1 Tax=Carnobacterium sp. TaxID=48221 RepID=UPI00388FB012